MNHFNPWSSAVLSRLHQLCDERPRPAFYHMARILNEEFGLSLTANACIGKAYRILSGAQSWQSPVLQLPIPFKPFGLMPPIEAEIERPQPGERLTIHQLRKGRCKWPYGDRAPYLYCGKRTPEGSSYCNTHCTRAYTTPRVSWT